MPTTPAISRTYEPESGRAKARAARAPSPVLLIAAPMIRPLSTSQKAEDPNPEKTPRVEPTPLSVATAKNSNAVTNSGRRPVAHRLMHRNVIPPAWATCGASPTSGPAAHTAPAPHSSTVGTTADDIWN